MKELRITDAEMQRLVALPLRTYLIRHGFKHGEASTDHAIYAFPVALDLAGVVTVVHEDDGHWRFVQETDETLSDRLDSSLASHTEAVVAQRRSLAEE